ncbi:MAG: VOC family protein, partial [Alphaproteobacteria bacterium]|nr:VOC family protein [Alphaproteobacteria bacterium]
GELETGATALAFADETLAAANGVRARPNRRDGEPAGAEVALVTADVEAAYARALGAGAWTVAAPTSKPWGQTVAYVRDGNGFLVELCTPMAP